MSKFPDIQDNLTLIGNGDKEALGQLTYKLKQITRGMKAAHQADTCMLKGAILGLARAHVEQIGRPLDTRLRKEQCGIKNEGTGCLFLPPAYMDTYLSGSEEFQAKVDRGEIMIGADEWPAFLYDEEEYDKAKEWLGLFLGKMFVR
ncbi:hypothetical protein BDM02DRAFT_3133219, partial [Thelephora ganbajun]